MEEDIDGIPLDNSETLPVSSSGFVKSKWEELDPAQVADQAITTSKWEFDPVAPEPPKISFMSHYENSESESENESDSEEKRKRLREIEIKLVEYQDELESGKRPKKSGYSISEQVEHYRVKLLRKTERHDSDGSQHSDRYASSSSRSKRDRRSSSSGSKRAKKSRASGSSEREREKRHHRSKLREKSRSRSHSPKLSK